MKQSDGDKKREALDMYHQLFGFAEMTFEKTPKKFKSFDDCFDEMLRGFTNTTNFILEHADDYLIKYRLENASE